MRFALQIEVLEKKLEKAKAYGIRMKKANDDLLRELEDSGRNQGSQDLASKLAESPVPLPSPCSAAKPHSTLKGPRRTRFGTTTDPQTSHGKDTEPQQFTTGIASGHQGPITDDLSLCQALPSKNDSNSNGAVPQASTQAQALDPPPMQNTPCASTYANMQGGLHALDCQVHSVGSRPAKPTSQPLGFVQAACPKAIQVPSEPLQGLDKTQARDLSASAPLPSLSSNSVHPAESAAKAILQDTPVGSVRLGLPRTPFSCPQTRTPHTLAAADLREGTPQAVIECPPTVKADAEPGDSQPFQAGLFGPLCMAINVEDIQEDFGDNSLAAHTAANLQPAVDLEVEECQADPQQSQEAAEPDHLGDNLGGHSSDELPKTDFPPKVSHMTQAAKQR